MQEATHIPTDLDACQTLILEQARTLLDIQKSKEDLAKEVSELKLQITKLMQRLYGQKSERNTDDPKQMQLCFGDDEQAKDAVSTAVLDAEKFVTEYTVRRTTVKQKKQRKLGDDEAAADAQVDAVDAAPAVAGDAHVIVDLTDSENGTDEGYDDDEDGGSRASSRTYDSED